MLENSNRYIKSLDILQELNLFDQYNELIQMHKQKNMSYAFTYINLAEKSLPISRLFNLIKAPSGLMPPRTGHLGNWNDMLEGYVAQRNDNTIICGQQNLGYPLIFDLNQTENETLTEGDLTYLPGSIVNSGKRKKLQLYTWDGTEFVKRTREYPLFVPFVYTKINGEFKSLVLVHRMRVKKYQDTKIDFFSSIVMKYKNKVKKILITLIEDIGMKENSEHELKLIINRFVTLDGRITKALIKLRDDGYYVGNTLYKDSTSLVDAILIPYQAASEPEMFVDIIARLPEAFPLLSNHVISIFCAVLYTHFPDCELDSISQGQVCNVHLQWGGIMMAGYLPKKTGYFVNQVRYIRRIYQQLYEKIGLPPVFFILIPSSIFLLWPDSVEKKDIKQVDQLINRVLKKVNTLLGATENEMRKGIYSEVQSWCKIAKNNLSETFIKRFEFDLPPALELDEIPRQRRFVEPENFSKLTIQQASILVSILFESL